MHEALQELSDQPEIKLADGSLYKARGAWDDLQEAIINAKHIIYITGKQIQVLQALLQY